MGLGRWYYKHNSFWNDADRRRRRARQAEKRRVQAAEQQAAVRHNVDAAIQSHLARTGRPGLTTQEVREIELDLRRTNMSNAEIREQMAAVRFWLMKPGKR